MTDQTKHTPGPWTYEGVFAGHPLRIMAADGGAVAAVVRETHKTIYPAARPLDEVDANARLIAAAPELAEALREMAARLDALGPDEMGPGYRVLSDRARAALAKAGL